jgi:hypothetical protein
MLKWTEMKRKTFRNKKRATPQTLLLPAIAFAFLFMATAILYQGVVINGLEKQNRELANQNFEKMVQDAARNSYYDAVLNASEQRVFIPEARLAVALNNDTRSLAYTYFIDDVGEVEIITLSSRRVLSAPFNINEQFYCGHMLEISTQGPSYDFMTSAGQLNLSDGRNYSIYTNSDKSCLNLYGQSELDNLLSSIKNAQPY